MKIFFDGSARPNPGPIEVAAVARKIVSPKADALGSSHRAEWLALLHAMDVAAELGFSEVELIGDSRAVVEQANRRSKCRGAEFQSCLDRLDSQRAAFRTVRIRHVKRGQNLAGIALARLQEAALPRL